MSTESCLFSFNFINIFYFRLSACLPLCTGLGVAALQRGNRVDIASEPTWPHSALEPSRENKDQKFSGFSVNLDNLFCGVPVPEYPG